MPEYWMRSIDFVKMANILKMVICSPEKWSAAGLDRAGIDEGIFKTGKGKPFGPTSCYRYRRMLEKLDLVEKRNRRFIAKLSPSECQEMLTANKANGLNKAQRYLLGSRVVSNLECYETLWKAFLPSKRPKSLDEFIGQSDPIVMNAFIGSKKARSHSHISITNQSHSQEAMQHSGYNAIQAIHYGMRNWGVVQLGFLDEFYQVGIGYHLIPVRLVKNKNTDAVERAIVESLNFRNHWAVTSISEVLLKVSGELRVPLKQVKSVLSHWVENYPNLLAPVSVSNRMLLFAQPEKLHSPILKGFLKLRTGEHVSHLHIHSNLLHSLAVRGQKEASIGS